MILLSILMRQNTGYVFRLILVFGVKFLIPPYLGIFHAKCLDLMILT